MDHTESVVSAGLFAKVGWDFHWNDGRIAFINKPGNVRIKCKNNCCTPVVFPVISGYEGPKALTDQREEAHLWSPQVTNKYHTFERYDTRVRSSRMSLGNGPKWSAVFSSCSH